MTELVNKQLERLFLVKFICDQVEVFSRRVTSRETLLEQIIKIIMLEDKTDMSYVSVFRRIKIYIQEFSQTVT